MIIGIQSSPKKKNNYTGIASLLSSLTALMCNAKTLVIPFCNSNIPSVDKLLDYESIKEERERDNKNYSFDKNEIDTLIRNAKISEIQRGVLETKSVSLIATKDESILNIIRPTLSPTFESNMVEEEDAIRKVLERANEDFQYVFVILPRQDDLKKKILKYCNYNIICVPQSDAVEAVTFADVDLSKSTNEGQKDIFVVADFDEESAYTIQRMRRVYKTKCLYPCLHNSAYKDAFTDKKILNFVRNNFKSSEEENNYQFFLQLKTLIEEFATEVKADDYVDNYLVSESLLPNVFMEEKEIKTPTEMTENFEVVRTKGSFGKIKEEVKIKEPSEKEE